MLLQGTFCPAKPTELRKAFDPFRNPTSGKIDSVSLKEALMNAGDVMVNDEVDMMILEYTDAETGEFAETKWLQDVYGSRIAISGATNTPKMLQLRT